MSDSFDGNFDEFIGRAAAIMSKDRNDLWATPEDATRNLVDWANTLENSGEEWYSISSGSFKLSRNVDEDGYVEWNLDRHVIDFWEDETSPGGFDWDLKTN